MPAKKDLSNIPALVLGAWNDDIECFSALYLLTVDDTYNYCRHILGDDRSASFAVCDVYTTALKNILKLKDPSLFTSWIRRIAFDICYEKVISDSRTDLYSLLHPEELESLPFSEKQIFFLHDFVGLQEKDIANALHITKKHVEKCLASSREHILELRKLQGSDSL